MLFFLAVALALANVWISAVRSTIPVKFDDRVVSREVRTEKHPGNDDVCLLYLDPAGLTQVDRRVYEAVQDGDSLQKASWSRTLNIGANSFELKWSIDCRGMVIAMPLTLAVILLTGTVVWSGNRTRPSRRSNQPTSD
jgi:hypothetical protein